MKKRIAWMMLVLMIGTLMGCAGAPEETTLPPETTPPTETVIPETTVPPTTEPQAPSGFVSLNEIIAGTDITMSMEGETIRLSEDGLTIEMSIHRKEVYRNGYIAGIMKDKPIMEDGLVYIHEDFVRSFFCGNSADDVSMFHGTQFFADEVIAALEDPEGSAFNAKLLEEVCLPASMGIEIPNIDPGRIFSETPMSELSGELVNELRMYGYTGDHVYGEYAMIVKSRTTDEDGQQGEQAILDRMTDEQEAFFAEKNIQLADYYDLHSWFQGGFAYASDEELIEALETCYKTKLALSLGWEYPET